MAGEKRGWVRTMNGGGRETWVGTDDQVSGTSSLAPSLSLLHQSLPRAREPRTSSCLSVPPLTSQPLTPCPPIRFSSRALIRSRARALSSLTCSPRSTARPFSRFPSRPLSLTAAYSPSPTSPRAALRTWCPNTLQRPRPAGLRGSVRESPIRSARLSRRRLRRRGKSRRAARWARGAWLPRCDARCGRTSPTARRSASMAWMLGSASWRRLFLVSARRHVACLLSHSPRSPPRLLAC